MSGSFFARWMLARAAAAAVAPVAALAIQILFPSSGLNPVAVIANVISGLIYAAGEWWALRRPYQVGWWYVPAGTSVHTIGTLGATSLWTAIFGWGPVAALLAYLYYPPLGSERLYFALFGAASLGTAGLALGVFRWLALRERTVSPREPALLVPVAAISFALGLGLFLHHSSYSPLPAAWPPAPYEWVRLGQTVLEGFLAWTLMGIPTGALLSQTERRDG